MEKTMEKKESEEKKLSWIDLSEEEVLDITDVSVCMYGMQDDDSEK